MLVLSNWRIRGRKVDGNNNYTYTVATENGGGRELKIISYDITLKTNPIKKDEFSLAYDENAGWVYLKNDLFFVEYADKVEMFDVSNPSDITYVREVCQLQNKNTMNVFVDGGDYLYCVEYTYGLYIYDFSEPAAEPEVSLLSNYKPAWGKECYYYEGVYVREDLNLLYLGCKRNPYTTRLVILNITNKAEPTILSLTTNYFGDRLGDVNVVEVGDPSILLKRYAYQICESSSLRFYDVTDPENTTIIETLPFDYVLWADGVTDGKYYYSKDKDHLRIYNPDGRMNFSGNTSISDCGGKFNVQVLARDDSLDDSFASDILTIEVVHPVYGNYCKVCHGILGNDTQNACNGHGECVFIDTCICEQNYYSQFCNITECYGVLSNASSEVLCSGHGICWPHDHCECSENYYGEICNITICEGELSNVTNLCGDFGYCWPFEQCSCDVGYYEYCNVTTCFDVFSNESANVCSEHGVCWPKDTCSCDSSGHYFGIDCNYTWCNSEPTNISQCNEHGICWPYEQCNCEENYYYGDSCNITTCDSIFSNDTSEEYCSKHGTCGPIFDRCHCVENYYGDICNITICNGIFSNYSSCCTGPDYGQCIYFEQCDCKPNYYGENCNVTRCDGEFSNISSVCTIYGECWPFGICSCGSGYFGETCNVTTCYGEYSNTSEICSTHGVCWPENECICEEGEGYFGPDCNHTWCNGKPSNTSGYCSDHGSCWPLEHCNCDTHYYGGVCNITTCNGFFSNDTMNVCTGRGYCWPFETCHCDGGYFGSEECNVTTCYGVFSNLTSEVCSGKGICWPHELCNCEENYYGVYCNETICNEVWNNQSTHLICSGHGACEFYDHCECEETYYGIDCEISTCFDVIGNSTTELVCSNHGECVNFNSCVCESDNYFGEECQTHYCFEFMNNDTLNVCFGHGECFDYNNCSCFGNYTHHGELERKDCSNWFCFSHQFDDDPSEVCSGHGTCDSPDNCSCYTNYSLNECQSWNCYDENVFDEETVCGGHGDCIGYNNCTCTTTDYTSFDCSVFTCFNVSSQSSESCGTFGTCTDIDECTCFYGYFSPSPLSYEACQGFNCFGSYKNLPTVCSERGSCIAPGICSCKNQYDGAACETWSCGGYKYDVISTCSAKGNCLSPQNCECEAGYAGDICQTNTLYVSVMLPVLSVVGFSGALLLLGIILCVIFCGFVCCCIVCCSTLSVLVLLSRNRIQKVRMKRFAKLKNFDLLLHEQQMEEDTSIAHISIKKDIFKIDYEDIKLLSVLGQGGSNSTVYKAKWNSIIIAYKCFKTSDVCESQHTFDEFEKEVSILGSVSHPFILQFYGCCLNPPRVGILMEFCENGDLNMYIQRYREVHDTGMKFSERMRFLEEIASSCHYLHSKNVIHRDLKLVNVLIDKAIRCKLMDFGLSKIVDRMSRVKTKMIGTSFFIAPELILGDGDYDEKVDVFAFSICMYIILTERFHPYGLENTIGVEMRVASSEDFRPDLKFLGKKISDGDEEEDVRDEFDESVIPRRHLDWIRKLIRKTWSHDSFSRPSFSEICGIFKKKLDEERETPDNLDRESSSSSSSSEPEKEEEEDVEEEEKLAKISKEGLIRLVIELRNENKRINGIVDRLKLEEF